MERRRYLAGPIAPLVIWLAAMACDRSPTNAPISKSAIPVVQLSRLTDAPWSAPVNLGATINTSANEQGPNLSKDGLSLFFGSDRAGGSGGFDLYVSQRACLECPWQAPVNLGPTINSAGNETGPGVSIDGHILFFTSNRAGGQGMQDLYLAHRSNPTDDFGWGLPVPLGTDINTAAAEAGIEYLQNAEEGASNVYFNRGPVTASSDIYTAAITRSGETRGPATLVAELSHPTATDQGVTLRGDAKEIFFFSTRPGGLGGNDLWTSTRQNVNAVWATPTNPGTPLNSAAADQQPSLSFDGRTLVFASSRTGSFGGTDIWIATRGK